MKAKITIIGYGNMGRAIGRALQTSGASVVGIRRGASEKSRKAVAKSDIVVLAVKPQDAAEALHQFKNYLAPKAILISILAGVPLRKIAKMSGHKKIVRMMPNMGLRVGEGIAAWKREGLSAKEKIRVRKVLDSISENFEVKDENAIDKITAISGSGPAYFFLWAEHLLASAKKLGLGDDASQRLVEKTFSASAKLSRGGNYAELIRKIASKGGTTEAALKIFAKKKTGGIMQEAVRAAHRRARALSR